MHICVLPAPKRALHLKTVDAERLVQSAGKLPQHGFHTMVFAHMSYLVGFNISQGDWENPSGKSLRCAHRDAYAGWVYAPSIVWNMIPFPYCDLSAWASKLGAGLILPSLHPCGVSAVHTLVILWLASGFAHTLCRIIKSGSMQCKPPMLLRLDLTGPIGD